MSFPYLSQVSGFATGLAGSTTVTAQITSGGAAPATASGATVGTVFETSTPGTYICLVTYTAGNLPVGTAPVVHWSVNGALIDDPMPLPLFQATIAAVNGPVESVTNPVDFIGSHVVPIGAPAQTADGAFNAMLALAAGDQSWVGTTLTFLNTDGSPFKTWTTNTTAPTSGAPTSRTS
jgi:hypothetical protein